MSSAKQSDLRYDEGVRAALAVLVFTGCSGETVKVSAEANDLVILARGEGSNLTATLVGEGSREVEGGETVSVFVVRTSDLMLLDGARLPAEWRPEILVDAPRGACPCVAPMSRPLAISPGERCPVPHFAENVRGDLATLDRLSLEWPGACPCTVEEVGSVEAAENDFIRVDGVDSAWAAALDLEGRLVVANEKGIERIGDPAPIWVGDVGLLAGTTEPLLVPFPGGVFWVREQVGSAYDQQIEIVRSDGARSTEEFSAFRIRDIYGYEGGFLVAGLDSGGSPKLVTCVDPELSRCASLLPADFQALDREFLRIHRTTGGPVAVHGSTGLLIIERLPAAADITGVRVDPSISEVGWVGAIETRAGEVGRMHFFANAMYPPSAYDIADLDMNASGVFVCYSVERDRILRAVLARADRPEKLFVEPFQLATTPIFEADERTCLGVDFTTDERVVFATGARTYDCDAINCSLVADHSPDTWVHGLARFSESSEGRYVEGRFEPIVEWSELRSEVVAIAAGDPTSIALSIDGTVTELDGASVTRRRSLPFPGPLLAGDFDHRQGALWVAGASAGDDCRPWLGTLDLESGELSSVELPSDRLHPCEPILQLAEGAPGRLLASTAYELFSIVEGDVRLLRVEPDDPSTPEQESFPIVCTGRRNGSLFHQGSAIWMDIDAGGGSAFAVGCGGAVVRVNLMADPPTTEGLSSAETTQTLGRSPGLTAVASSCGGVASISARLVSPATREVGVLTRVEPEDPVSRTPTGFVRARLTVDDTNLISASHDWIDSRFPVDTVGGPRPLVVFPRSAHFAGARGRSWFQGSSPIRTAALTRGGILLGTRRGGLLFMPTLD